MTKIAYRILKLESMIKKPMMENHAFFTSITFSRISSFPYYQFYRNTAYKISNLQKDSHQDNLSFVCL